MKFSGLFLNRLKSVFWVLISFIVFFTGTASAERLSVKASKANIRSGPGTSYDVLWEVEKYHPFLIIDKKDQWYRFRDFEGDEGWIYKSLLSDIKTVITIKNKCRIRKGPGQQHDILFTTDKGIPFKVLEQEAGWIHVEHADGDKGWIYKTLVW
ncbi:MAG: SH3 domain-containing protein [Desulfobacterales bacterium]